MAIIYYPISFLSFLPPPTLTTLGGIFANPGNAHEWVKSINTDGTVTFSQPSFADISGTISPSQIPHGSTFNVLAYGADPTGSADSTSAFAAAIAACNSVASTFHVPADGGGTVYVPAGSYLLSQIQLPSFVNLKGDGPQSTYLIQNGQAGHFIILADDSGSGSADVTWASVTDLCLQFTGSVSGGPWDGIHFYTVSGISQDRHLNLSNLYVIGASRDGVAYVGSYGNNWIEHVEVHNAGRYGLNLSTVDTIVADCSIGISAQHGVYMSGAANIKMSNVVSWYAGGGTVAAYDGFFLDTVRRSMFVNCDAQNNGQNGWSWQNDCYDVAAIDCLADNNGGFNSTGSGFWITDSNHITMKATAVNFAQGGWGTNTQAYALFISTGSSVTACQINLVSDTPGTADCNLATTAGGINLGSLGDVWINGVNLNTSNLQAWSGVVTNTSGFQNGNSLQVELEPASDSSANFTGFNISTFIPPTTTANLSGILVGGYGEVRHEGTGTITRAVGVEGVGLIVPSTGQNSSVTEAIGLFSQPYSSFSNTITSVVATARGVRVINSGVSNADNTITNQIGISVDNLTTGTHNVSVLLGAATPPGASYALYDATNLPSVFSGTVTLPIIQDSTGSTGTSGYVLSQTTGNETEWVSPGSLSTAWSGIGNPSGNLALTMGTDTSTFNYTGSSTLWTWANTTASVSGGSGQKSSPTLALNGTYWNGSASATESWTIQAIASTTSTDASSLTVTHSGASAGNPYFAAPNLSAGSLRVSSSGGSIFWSGGATINNNSGAGITILNSSAGSGTVNGLATPAASGSATFTQTIASGTAVLGTSAITSGTAATIVQVAATGVLTTDNVLADFNADPTSTTGYEPSANGMLTIIKFCTAGYVNFYVVNNTASSITPGAVTLNWRVVR